VVQLNGFLNFFGRLSILVDENTHAFHFFITALLQVCESSTVSYVYFLTLFATVGLLSHHKDVFWITICV
jgi:hypothetical protein